MVATLRLSLNDGGPLYRRVRDALAGMIERGELGRGQQLPSERSLCEQFDMSRVTIRKALSVLSDEGVIDAVPGRGWFVADGTVSDPRHMLKSFSALAAVRGLAVSSRVLAHAVRPASFDEADWLQIVPGADVVQLDRLRSLDGLPVCIERSLLPLAVCAELASADFSTASLYQTIRTGSGLIPTRAECQVEARKATADDAALLGMDPADPVLVTEQLTYDQRGGILEGSVTTFRGDRHRFRATLTSDR
jgi:GntR family transcriptional regulator